MTVRVPPPLRDCCNGERELTLGASSVRAALEVIERAHPVLHRNICDETGAPRRHINLFVNSTHVRDQGGLDTALMADDVITILPAVSGG